MKIQKVKLYFLLFRMTFSISAFTFGGGYIAIPMIRKYFVDDLELITDQDLIDMSAIAQSTPGAIAVNIAVLVGYRLAGLTGAIISCVGTILPPILIISLISLFYQEFRQNSVISAILKGMEAGVAAVIVNLVIDMGQVILKEKNFLLTILPVLVFISSFLLNVNVYIILFVCTILCILQTYIKRKKKGGF